MEPKLKAKELVNKFSQKAEVLNQDTDWDYDKECALIAVDLVLSLNDIDSEYSYYLEVKQEIEKL